MTNVTIINRNGTLYCDVLDWEENQTFQVATRNLPMNTNGKIIDYGTWVIKPKMINLTLRASASELITLDAINESKTDVTIKLSDESDVGNLWSFTGVLENFIIKYELSYDGTTEREWVVDLEIKVKTFYYGGT